MQVAVQGRRPKGARCRTRPQRASPCAPTSTDSASALPCGSRLTSRKRLEQLCRYSTRPALANERVQTNAAGQVVLKFKTHWRDGTTHLAMSPLEFMQRLAALVPRP